MRIPRPIWQQEVARSAQSAKKSLLFITADHHKVRDNEALTFTIRTECAHCGKEICIEMDSELHFSVSDPGARPLVFVPMVDFSSLEDASIIDAF